VSNAWRRFAVAETGERVGFDMCFAADCGLHLSRCACEDGPTPPRLGASAGEVRVDPLSVSPAA
jgi:hypothetical protein